MTFDPVDTPAGGLSTADERLLDRLVEANFDPAAMTGLTDDERHRVEALAGLFGLLDDYPIEDADDALVDATMARLRRSIAPGRLRLAGEPATMTGERSGVLRRIRLPDFMSIAAILLIGVSIGWPVLATMRQRSIDAACVNNLRTLSGALTSYANDFDGHVPMMTAGFGADSLSTWVDPTPLVRLGYCAQGHANCPGHSSDMGYSRQVMRPGSMVSWFTGPNTAILGDRNPIIDGRATAIVVNPTANSTNHSGRGQNLLMKDGSTLWLGLPVVGEDDNIWLIQGTREYEPGAMPQSDADVFLAH